MTIKIHLNENINPQSLIDKGWVEIDPPGKFSFEMWDYFLSIIGQGNYEIMITSEDKENDWKRGQLLISPAGMENLKAAGNQQ